MSGTLALVGGAEWQSGCEFDRELLELSGGTEVLVLPTAAAYEHPQRAVDQATSWFAELGATVRALDVLTRPDALVEEHAATVRDASFVYLSGGSPMHLRSVLKDSPVWEALVAGWLAGAVLAGSGSGAMVLCDPMVDPRGGALTLGLGLVGPMAVIPHHGTWSEDKAKRTLHIAPAGLPIVGVDERTAVIRDPAGTWRAGGVGQAVVHLDGQVASLDRLP